MNTEDQNKLQKLKTQLEENNKQLKILAIEHDKIYNEIIKIYNKESFKTSNRKKIGYRHKSIP